MAVRSATSNDAAEVVRLAGVMFEAMGVDASGDEWQASAERHLHQRLGRDVAVFVAGEPGARPGPGGRLVAAGAGTVAQRLPTPGNPSGRAGYIQWVCTDPGWRRTGLARAAMEALLR